VQGSSLDYVRGERLIKSMIQQLQDLRSEESFHGIYDKAKKLCDENSIDLLQLYRPRRDSIVSTRFRDCFIDSTLGHRETISNASDYLARIYFPLIDCLLIELNDRFSSQTLSLMKSISTVYPESENFLDTEAVEDFGHHIGVDSSALKNEFIVIKSMLHSKKIDDVIQFLNELTPLKAAFPQTLRMIKSAVTMPISQVTCERTFSKMKIIKNYLRNSMSDQRLSDLTILSVERDIPVDYEQVVDKFSKSHKSRRILLQ
jgi:hypothetical protein